MFRFENEQRKNNDASLKHICTTDNKLYFTIQLPAQSKYPSKLIRVFFNVPVSKITQSSTATDQHDPEDKQYKFN